MPTEITQLDHPIDVMCLIHNAIRFHHDPPTGMVPAGNHSLRAMWRARRKVEKEEG